MTERIRSQTGGAGDMKPILSISPKSRLDRNNEYKTLIQSLPDAVLVMDIAGNIIAISHQTLTLFGFSNELELINKKFFDFIAPESKARAVIYLHKTLKQGLTQNMEYIFLKKNGERLTGEVNMSRLSDESGQAHKFIATVRDITSRKIAENDLKNSIRDKELLLQEIHHRVKNNLQIVSSILDMSRMRIQDPDAEEFITNACSKIQSMAFIHTQLYRHDCFDRIDMRSHIQELLPYISLVYGEAKKIKTYLNISEIYLSLDQAIPCALVLNELVSNAYKHAFSRGREGVIEVSMNLREGSNVLLQVRDNGTGISNNQPNKPSTASLGLKLVRNLVEKQLKGSLRISRGQYTEFSVEFEAKDQREQNV